MSLAARVGKNFAIQTIGKVCSVFIGLGLIALLTRALGPTSFGAYTTAMNYLQFFGVIVDFGLTLTIVVMMSERGANESRVAGNILGLRLFSAALVFAIAPLIAIPFPYSTEVKAAILIGSLAYFFMAGATMLVGIYQRHHAMWRASLAEVSGRILLIALTGLFVWMGFGLASMMWALVAANIVWLVMTMRLAQPLVALRPRADLSVWKEALSRSWPIALSIAFNLVYLRGDVLILAVFRPSADVGFYGVAYRLLDVITTMPVMFMGLVLPTLTARWSGGDKVGFARILNTTFDAFCVIALPIVFGTIASADRLIPFIAGEGYEAAIPLLALLICTVPGIFLGGLYGHAVVAIGAQRRIIRAYALTAVLSLVGYFILIPSYGGFGAAIVTIASETLIALLTFVTVYLSSRARPSFVVFGKALFACIGMFIVVRALPASTSFPLVVGAAALIYVGLLGLMGLLKRSAWQRSIPLSS